MGKYKIQIQMIIAWLSIFIPKKKQICLYSNTYSHGNSFYFLHYLKHQKEIGATLVLLSDNGEKGTLKFQSITGAWQLIRSKVIISSHGIPFIKSKNQVGISFWHGIPIKGFPKDVYFRMSKYKNFIDYQITPSIWASNEFAKDWGLKGSQLKEMGEPVYDYLNNPESFLDSNEKAVINRIKAINKVALYAPTYRKSKYGSEGETIEKVLLEFEKLLIAKTDVHFILSMHPMEDVNRNAIKRMEAFKNFEIAPISTELIIPFVDTVILDCSSIYFHALYLKKRIIIFFPDKGTYEEKRPLKFKDEELFTPCMIVNDLNVLKKNLDASISVDVMRKREEIFSSEIGNCNQKILELIKENI
jgi:CDP-glycerol glycerophosphotransferase (TagB/SpsB family)